MTNDRDIERILDHWLAERPTQVADRVLDEVADRIARHPQRPAWRPLGGTSTCSRISSHCCHRGRHRHRGRRLCRPAAPCGLERRRTGPVVHRRRHRRPHPRHHRRAPCSAWFPPTADGAGILPAGSHTTDAFMPAFTFTVPEGWVNSQR